MECSPYQHKDFSRWLRKKLHLSIPQIVRYLSITESQLKHIESGRHPMPDKVARELQSIARSMGAKVEEFIKMYIKD